MKRFSITQTKIGISGSESTASWSIWSNPTIILARTNEPAIGIDRQGASLDIGGVLGYTKSPHIGFATGDEHLIVEDTVELIRRGSLEDLQYQLINVLWDMVLRFGRDLLKNANNSLDERDDIFNVLSHKVGDLERFEMLSKIVDRALTCGHGTGLDELEREGTTLLGFKEVILVITGLVKQRGLGILAKTFIHGIHLIADLFAFMHPCVPPLVA